MTESMKLKRKIIDLSTRILQNKIDALPGIRMILNLYESLPVDEYKKYQKLFLGFKGIESQFDHLPLGNERKLWDKEVLKDKDKEIDELKQFFKKDISQICEEIIKKLIDVNKCK